MAWSKDLTEKTEVREPPRSTAVDLGADDPKGARP